MQNATLFLQNALKQGEDLRPSVRAVVEWNHNRYTAITTVDNYQYAEKTYGYDLDMFPIETITEPLRPTAGLMKGRVGEGAVVQGYADTITGYKTYTADPDSKYKYWTSPAESNSTPYVGGGYTLPEPVRPHIVYASNVLTNKIYICTENSWASPQKYDVQITTNGTTWTTVASDIAPNSSGQVILYLQDGGTWTTTKNLNNATNIRGIKLDVKSMSKTGSWFNLIELGARLEKDLTERVIDFSVNNEMGESDFISPIGVISANTANINLSNIDGLFNHDNASSPYYGLIDANAKFSIDFGIDVSAWGGSGIEYIRMATMYAESWNGGEEEIEVSLKDASKFLQEIKPLPELMEDVTIGMAIWRILDSVGFNDYEYVRSAEVASNKIPFYWTNQDRTVWDNIQELCRVTQSACYFDEHGILQIKTRDSAFNKTAPVAWTLDYAQNGSKMPDIVNLEIDNNFEANKVTVKYQTTNLAQDALGRPVSEIVWQPEDTVTLRSSALTTAMTSTDTKFWIDGKDVASWPYEGIVNIHGELIRYKGKGYRYYPKGGSYTGNFANDTVFKVIYTNDEKNQIDRELSSEFHGWRNYFTGYMRVEERGYDKSSPIAHPLVQTAWTINGSRYGIGGSQQVWNGGMKFIPQDSLMRLQTTGKKATGRHWYTSRRGATINEPIKFAGTRMRFPSNPKGAHQAAGVWVWGNSGQSEMYGIDIQRTATVDRKINNEIRVLKRLNSGVVTHVGGKGAAYAIEFDRWYDIDVVVTPNADFTVFINGVLVLKVTDTGTDLTATGAAGTYVRGDGVADFEYFYMMAEGAIQETDLDNTSYLDLIRTGYYSNQYYKDFVSRSRAFQYRRGKKPVRIVVNWDQRYFDEFGMQVHEYRPFDVTFDKKPVLYSSLYVSNESQTVVDEYVHNPFGAHFIVANASRNNAVVNGQDTLTYGTDNPVEQKMMITGRTIQQAEAKDYVVKDDLAIRARGEIAIEFESQWIQSLSMAKSLGDWIVDNWADPCDEVQVQVFGNPLFQIGDIVAVNFPPKNMTAATHKYFVLGVDQVWDNGLGTTLTLRRARI